MLELSASTPAIYQLRVVLCGVSPLIWRRLLVSSESSIAELHEVLQIAFDWTGEHLHRFRIHGRDYGVLQVGGIMFAEEAQRVPLSRFRLHSGERFRYEYDFTAHWKLDVRLEQTLSYDSRRFIPSCIGGRRAAPMEDCAGARDYLERLEQHRFPIEDLAVMADAMQRFLDPSGDRKTIGDLDELREAIQRVDAYQELQPDRFDQRGANRRLRNAGTDSGIEP